MREIKFRAWDKQAKGMINPEQLCNLPGVMQKDDGYIILMQYTGLKDKNGLTEIYEYDIIDECGIVVGNTFENKEKLNEVDKGSTYLIVSEITGKDWVKTYDEAISRGCKHA